MLGGPLANRRDSVRQCLAYPRPHPSRQRKAAVTPAAVSLYGLTVHSAQKMLF